MKILIDNVFRDLTPEEIAARQRPFGDLKTEALAALADRRWTEETAGVEVAGAIIRTDDIGQGKIMGAIALFDNDPDLTSIDWEAQPGIWVTLDEATIRAVGVAVGRHVQACFTRARAISEQIQSAEDETALAAAASLIGPFWPQD